MAERKPRSGLVALILILTVPVMVVLLNRQEREPAPKGRKPGVTAADARPDAKPAQTPEADEGDADPMESEPEPKPKPAPKSRRKELMAKLRKRFEEDTLIKIAKESVASEDAIRAELGDSDEAYARMEKAWAELCRTHGLSAAEREALENEAIVKGWIGSPPD